MAKHKKEKIKTLSDEEYNQYIMSLKDESVTMLIDEEGNKTPQK